MNEPACYEQYPWRIVIVSNLFSIVIYGLGILIVGHFGVMPASLYLIYCGWIEFKVMRSSCVTCCYYGKRCAFGKGVVCSWIFNPCDSTQIPKRDITWVDILPDFLVVLLPLGAGLVCLLIHFHWNLVIQLILLLTLFFLGNGWIRGSLACPFCKRRLTGCPALEFFEKKQ